MAEGVFGKLGRYLTFWKRPAGEPQSPGYSEIERLAALAGDHTGALTDTVLGLVRSRREFETGQRRLIEENYSKVLEELGRMRADLRADGQRRDGTYSAFETRVEGLVKEAEKRGKGYTDTQVADAIGRTEKSLGGRIETARTEALGATDQLRQDTGEQLGALEKRVSDTETGLANTTAELRNGWNTYLARAGIAIPRPDKGGAQAS